MRTWSQNVNPRLLVAIVILSLLALVILFQLPPNHRLAVPLYGDF